MKTSIYLTVLAALCALTLLVSGCGGPDNPKPPPIATGTVKLQIYLPSGLTVKGKRRSISEITDMKVIATHAGQTTVTQALTIDTVNHVASATFLIPAATGWVFEVDATDATNTLIYSGKATASVVAGQTANIQIVLKPTNSGVDIIVIVHTGNPGIQFTYVPPIGSSDLLTGIVSGGVDPSKLAVAVYIKVGGGWWSKPYFDTPVTTVQSDGTWACNIVTGGQDETATEICAYLIWATEAPPTVGGGGLPDIPDALATVDVIRQ